MSYLCSICGDSDHSASRCKELAPPPAPNTTYEGGSNNYKNKTTPFYTSQINISKIQNSYKLWYQRVLNANYVKKLS